MKAILSLCDYSGNWPKFYTAEEGYEVFCIDLKRGDDVRLLEYIHRPIHGILAAPDCAAFSLSGAQYWKAKDADGRTLRALALVDACLRAVAIYRPVWWALENPQGRLCHWLGPPAYSFNPCDFGDAYTKQTMLWGNFRHPWRERVAPVRDSSQGSWIQKLGGKSERTKELRSTTPLGFARAFREANP